MKFVLAVFAIIVLSFLVNQYLSSNKAKENIALGQAYLDKNAKEEGVQVTASGLQYKVLEWFSEKIKGFNTYWPVYKGQAFDICQFKSYLIFYIER